MALPTISGQSLVDDLIIRLEGYAAAYDATSLLSMVNEGKDAVWGVLRTLDEDYFVVSSQATTSTDDDYFAPLTTTVREVNLPNNCREVRMIEVTTPGFEDLEFSFRRLSDPEFELERKLATIAGSGSGRQQHSKYLYTITGRRTLMLAQFIEAAVTAKLWYVRALDDLDLDGTLTEVLHPFHKAIVTFALERATLSLQDEQLSDGWLRRWRDDVRMLALVAAPRDSSGPEYVTEWDGSAEEDG